MEAVSRFGTSSWAGVCLWGRGMEGRRAGRDVLSGKKELTISYPKLTLIDYPHEING